MTTRAKKRRRNTTRKISSFCCIQAEVDDVGSVRQEEIEMSSLPGQPDKPSNTSKRQAQEETDVYSTELDELKQELSKCKNRVSTLEKENAELRCRLDTFTRQVTVVGVKDESEIEMISAKPRILIVYWNCDRRIPNTLRQKIETRQKWKVVVRRLQELQSESDECGEYSNQPVVFSMGLADRVIAESLTKTYDYIKSITKLKPILIPISGNDYSAAYIQTPPGMELVAAQRIDYNSSTMDALSEEGFTDLLRLLTNQLKN